MSYSIPTISRNSSTSPPHFIRHPHPPLLFLRFTCLLVFSINFSLRRSSSDTVSDYVRENGRSCCYSEPRRCWEDQQAQIWCCFSQPDQVLPLSVGWGILVVELCRSYWWFMFLFWQWKREIWIHQPGNSLS